MEDCWGGGRNLLVRIDGVMMSSNGARTSEAGCSQSEGPPYVCVSLQGFLQDLFLQHGKPISPDKLEEYTNTMVTSELVDSGGKMFSQIHSYSSSLQMKMFDKNRDGRLDLNDLARYC